MERQTYITTKEKSLIATRIKIKGIFRSIYEVSIQLKKYFIKVNYKIKRETKI